MAGVDDQKGREQNDGNVDDAVAGDAPFARVAVRTNQIQLAVALANVRLFAFIFGLNLVHRGSQHCFTVSAEVSDRVTPLLVPAALPISGILLLNYRPSLICFQSEHCLVGNDGGVPVFVGQFDVVLVLQDVHLEHVASLLVVEEDVGDVVQGVQLPLDQVDVDGHDQIEYL